MANQRDPLSGNVYIKRNPSDKEKAPYMTGFVGVSKELLEKLLSLEEDDYGSVKLELSLWTNPEQPGVLKGKAQLPYAVRKEMTASPAPVKPAPKKAAPAVETDVDGNDLPF